MNKLLILTFILSFSISICAQSDKDTTKVNEVTFTTGSPEWTVGEYEKAFESENINKISEYISAETKKELRELVSTLIKLDKTGDGIKTIFSQLPDKDELKGLNEEQVLQVFYKAVYLKLFQNQWVKENLKNVTSRIIGHVNENDSICYVLTNLKLSMQGLNSSNVKVNTMVRENNTWKLSFVDETKSLGSIINYTFNKFPAEDLNTTSELNPSSLLIQYQMAPDSSIYATSGTLVLYDYQKDKKKELMKDMSQTRHPRLSPDGKKVFFFNDEVPHKGSISILDIKDGHVDYYKLQSDDESGIWNADFLDEDNLIYTDGGKVYSYSLSDKNTTMILDTRNSFIWELSVSPNKKLIAAASTDGILKATNGYLQIYNTENKDIFETDYCMLAGWSFDGNKLFARRDDLRIIDFNTRKVEIIGKELCDSIRVYRAKFIDNDNMLFNGGIVKYKTNGEDYDIEDMGLYSFDFSKRSGLKRLFKDKNDLELTDFIPGKWNNSDLTH